MKLKSGRYWKRKHGGYAIAYFLHNVEQRESVARALGRRPHEVTAEDAKALLEQRLAERREGVLIIPQRAPMTIADVLDNRIQTMRLARRKGMKHAETQSRRIVQELGAATLVRDVNAPSLKRWAEDLKAKGFAPGTVALRLAHLRAALNLASHENLFTGKVPAFPSIRVDNARQGFFEAEQIAAVVDQLPPAIADVVRFGHQTGWRREEIVSLQWAQVDRARGEIRLGDSKNGDGRVLPLVGGLAELIEQRWKKRVVGGDMLTTWVFHRHGKRIKHFNHVWRLACIAAHVPGRYFHDLRRTAARDLVDSGADYKTAMTVTGHRSLSMFMRYRIVSTKTTALALNRLQAHRAVQ